MIVSTGSIYVKSVPAKAEIYINGKLEGKTNDYVSRLSPQIYDVKVIKEGYYAWEKYLNVRPGLVELADSILLLPQAPKIFLTLQADLKWYSLLPNNRELLYYATNSFYLLNLSDNSVKKPIISMPWKFSPQNFIWSNDNENFIMQQNNQYYLANINNPNMFIDLNGLIKKLSKYEISSIEKLNFESAGDKIYFLFENNLYGLTLNKQNSAKSTLSKVLIPNVINYAVGDSKIIYLNDSTGKINLFDIATNQEQTFIDEVIPAFNSGKWVISPDKKKLSCEKESSVEILWLEDENGQISRQKGDTEKIDFDEPISNVIWYKETDEHLFVSTADSILVAELDNREPRNIVKYITAENPQIIYDSANKILYFLSQNKLYQTEI